MPKGTELSAEEALDHVLSQEFEAMLTVNNDGNVSRCNSLAKEVYDQGVGAAFQARIHPADWELIATHLEEQIRFQVTVRLGTPGHWILGQMTAVPCDMADAAWIVLWSDVTAAILQARHHEAFIQGGERFGWLPWHMDIEREEAKLWPGTYEVLFGKSVDKPQIVTLAEVQAVMHPSEDPDSIVGAVREARRRGESFHQQYAVVHPNGQVRWIQSLGVATRDLDDVVHFEGVMRDATDEHNQALALIRAQYAESVRLLAGGLAHDLNNQLQVIMAHLSLLQEHVAVLEADRRSKAADSLEWADTAVERARELAGELLILSRSAPPSLRPVAVPDLIRTALGALHNRVDIRVKAEWDSNLWAVMGDRIQLSQVLENLVHNAADAMPEGGRVQIRADNHQADRMTVAITVEDSGPGIPPELWGNIFDPYYSTKANGHGLGLAASQTIMQQHGGQLTVGVSSLGGAAFTVVLPATLECPLDGEGSDVHGVGQLSGTLLVVDDDAQVRAGAQALAQSYGLTTFAVADGPSALAWLEAHRCDLVMLDWVLGSPMAGHQVLDELRREYPEVLVVVSSGYADVPIPAGVPTLPKPYTREQMGRVLASLLQRS